MKYNGQILILTSNLLYFGHPSSGHLILKLDLSAALFNTRTSQAICPVVSFRKSCNLQGQLDPSSETVLALIAIAARASSIAKTDNANPVTLSIAVQSNETGIKAGQSQVQSDCSHERRLVPDAPANIVVWK